MMIALFVRLTVLTVVAVMNSTVAFVSMLVLYLVLIVIVLVRRTGDLDAHWYRVRDFRRWHD